MLGVVVAELRKKVRYFGASCRKSWYYTCVFSTKSAIFNVTFYILGKNNEFYESTCAFERI